MIKPSFDFSKRVGEPMVEIGRHGLIQFCKKENFDNYKELEEQIEKLFKIYTYQTSGRIGQIFSSNSKFTHNSTGKDLNKRYKQALELYKNLMKESYIGYCIACGDKDNLSDLSKTIFPLITGDSNANFTSNFSNKFLLCKACMTSLFFSPTNMQKTAGKMGFYISNNEEINKYWREKNISEFNANILKNKDSFVDSGINIFENFIYKNIELLQEENLFGDITFYLISNVDKQSEIHLIHISERYINFIHEVAPSFFKDSLPTKQRDEWNYLIFKYASKDSKGTYRTRKENIAGKNTTINFAEEILEKKNYKSTIKYFNPLIVNFINGKSILYYLKENRCSWNLTKIYLEEIRGMNEERLKVLKRLADNLLQFNKDDTVFFRKVIRPIEISKSMGELREHLRMMMKKSQIETSLENPLFTVDEMVFQILPSGENWQETKDILLIALYEKIKLNELELTEEDNQNEKGEDNE